MAVAPEETGRPPSRPRPRALLTALASALLALVALELALRATDRLAGRADVLPRDEDVIYEPHPFLGYTLKPGIRRAQPELTTSSLGTRGRELAREKPPGTFRILCIGSSSTFGAGVRQEEATYPAQLERILDRKRPGGWAVEVGNCGVPGYTTAMELIDLELRRLELCPDAIVIYEGANDAGAIQSEGFLADYSHRYQAWREPLSPSQRWLARHWRTYARLAVHFEPGQRPGTLAAHTMRPGEHERHVPASRMVIEEGVQVFARNLRTMIVVARAHGIRPMLATFAYCDPLLQPGNLDLSAAVERMNAAVVELGAREGVSVARVAEALGGREDLFADWVHPNAEGSRLQAEVIARALVEHGYFAR
ncbi:MAG TPA: SGNH/GDSL hydrolase family protein [Planctomycetota bacterium]|nr:SGNH/GDSL hydrolase family protein [Planctomycetota bacterium]